MTLYVLTFQLLEMGQSEQFHRLYVWIILRVDYYHF